MGIRESQLSDVLRVKHITVRDGCLDEYSVKKVLGLADNEEITFASFQRHLYEREQKASCCYGTRKKNDMWRVEDLEKFLSDRGVDLEDLRNKTTHSAEKEFKKEDLSHRIIRSYSSAQRTRADKKLNTSTGSDKIAIAHFLELLYGDSSVSAAQKFIENFMLANPKTLNQKIEDEEIGLVVEKLSLEKFLASTFPVEKLEHFNGLMIHQTQQWLQKDYPKYRSSSTRF